MSDEVKTMVVALLCVVLAFFAGAYWGYKWREPTSPEPITVCSHDREWDNSQEAVNRRHEGVVVIPENACYFATETGYHVKECSTQGNAPCHFGILGNGKWRTLHMTEKPVPCPDDCTCRTISENGVTWMASVCPDGGEDE